MIAYDEEMPDSNELQRRRSPAVPPPSMGDSVTTPQQLRQRRARMFREKAKEQEFHTMSKKSQISRGNEMAKVYIVLLTALVVTIAALSNYTRPKFLFQRRKPPPPLYFVTSYPPSLILSRDLPRFFRTYSIATPENQEARDAVVKVIKSQKALQHDTGNQKVFLKAWDRTNVNNLMKERVCGKSFEDFYDLASEERQEDLLMWCLLATRVSEGYFLESVEILGNAFVKAKRRGMLVRKHKDHDEGGKGRISNAYYTHPRFPDEVEDDPASLPAMVLRWLFSNPESSLEDPTRSLQEVIFEYFSNEEQRDRYMVLDEFCNVATVPARAIAKQCTPQMDDECCYFVVPEKEAGRMTRSQFEENVGEKKSLRDTTG